MINYLETKANKHTKMCKIWFWYLGKYDILTSVNSFVIWNSSYQHDSYNIKKLTNQSPMYTGCLKISWLVDAMHSKTDSIFCFFLMSILVIFQLSNSHPHPPPKHTHTQTPRNQVRDKLPNLISITLWYLAFNRHTESNHSCIHVIIITIVLMMMEYMISVVFHSYVFCFMYLYAF